MALTEKQNRFVAEYLKDLNATQAAVRAGYSSRTAEKIGSENLQKPEVKSAIDLALARRAERVEVNQDDVLRELMRLGMSDPAGAFDASGNLLPIHSMAPEVRRAIASIKTRIDEKGATVVEIKWWDKTRGLELLGKHLGLYVEKVKVEAEDGLLAALKGIWAKRGGEPPP